MHELSLPTDCRVYTIMMSQLSRQGQFIAAADYFDVMLKHGVEPNKRGSLIHAVFRGIDALKCLEETTDKNINISERRHIRYLRAR